MPPNSRETWRCESLSGLAQIFPATREQTSHLKYVCCFAIMSVAFTVAYICAHIWLVATIAWRLSKGQWFRATGWACILAVLIYIDIQILG